MLIVYIVSGLFFLILAELLGSSKHIGKWWSFFLLWGTFVLPGIIAILASPSAKEANTPPSKTLKYIGVFVFFLGVIGSVPILISGSLDLMKINFTLAFALIGSYLYNLGSGNVKNEKPKFYFHDNFLKTKIKNEFKHNTANQKIKINIEPAGFYFILDNNQKKGAFTFEEIREMRINENQLVWRKGLDDWSKASDLEELSNIIIYNPPSIPSERQKEKEIVSDSKTRVYIPRKKEHWIYSDKFWLKVIFIFILSAIILMLMKAFDIPKAW